MSETLPPTWPPSGDVPDPEHEEPREPTVLGRVRVVASAAIAAMAANRYVRVAVLVGVLLWAALASLWLLVIILALTFSIFLHEMGHYLVAKRNGMKVTEFFLGFGPRIWSFRRGETEYGVKLIWLGAYVKIVGMSNLEEVAPEDIDRSYTSKPFSKRMPVILAGPAMNILLGFVLLVVVFAGFGRPSDTKWSVGSVSPGSAAAAAEIQPGDQLVAFDGQRLNGWQEFRSLAQAHAGTTVDITVLRGGTEVVLPVSLGWGLTTDAALALGLEEGDRVISVDGAAMPLYADLVGALGRADGPVSVEYARIVKDKTITGTVEVSGPIELPSDGSRGLLGITQNPVMEHPSVVEAAGDSVAAFGDLVYRSVEGMTKVFSPSGLGNIANQVADGGSGDGATSGATSSGGSSQSASASSGEDRPMSIIGIANVATQMSEEFGWAAMLGILASVNIFLGLFNLIPLLPLDGGHIVVACYEEIRSRISGRQYRVDMAKLMPLTYVVFFLLIAFALPIMYLDLINL